MASRRCAPLAIEGLSCFSGGGLIPSCSDVKNKLAPPASCYDAGLATVNANGDKFSPVIRSCGPQQPPPEPEEEYTSDENDKDDKPLPAAKIFQHFFKDKFVQHRFKDNVLNFVTSFNFGSHEVRKTVEQWVATWKKSDGDVRPWTWIHVHAYYSKKKGHGGYGVILRNSQAEPIIASAKFSKSGVSFYYQIFKGINAGVKHAEHLNLSGLHVRCRSVRVPPVFCSLSECPNDSCKDGTGPICKRCAAYFVVDRCETAKPLVVELRRKNLSSLKYSSRRLPGRYVAKMEKKKILEGLKDESSDESVLSRDDFPQGLKDILWAESFAMNREVERTVFFDEQNGVF